MLLLTFNEWIGPSRDHGGTNPIQPIQRDVAFATRMPFGDALRSVRIYQDEYNRHYYPLTEVNLRLIGASAVDDADFETLQGVDVSMVEMLDGQANKYDLTTGQKEQRQMTKTRNSMTKLTPEEHRQRHEMLHKHLDELVTDYLRHHREAWPDNTTLMQLMEWSNQQQIEPDPDINPYPLIVFSQENGE